MRGRARVSGPVLARDAQDDAAPAGPCPSAASARLGERRWTGSQVKKAAPGGRQADAAFEAAGGRGCRCAVEWCQAICCGAAGGSGQAAAG